MSDSGSELLNRDDILEEDFGDAPVSPPTNGIASRQSIFDLLAPRSGLVTSINSLIPPVPYLYITLQSTMPLH